MPASHYRESDMNGVEGLIGYPEYTSKSAKEHPDPSVLASLPSCKDTCGDVDAPAGTTSCRGHSTKGRRRS